jgi:hypothetical protein
MAMVGVSVFLVCLSLSAAMLHWRVDNEPGATASPGLETAGFALFLSGAAGTVLFSVDLIRKGKRHPARLLIPAGIALLVYSPLFMLTMILMV